MTEVVETPPVQAAAEVVKAPPVETAAVTTPEPEKSLPKTASPLPLWDLLDYCHWAQVSLFGISEATCLVSPSGMVETPWLQGEGGSVKKAWCWA